MRAAFTAARGAAAAGVVSVAFPCCSSINVTSNIFIYLLFSTPSLLQDVTTAQTLRTYRSWRWLGKEKGGFQGRRFCVREKISIMSVSLK